MKRLLPAAFFVAGIMLWTPVGSAEASWVSQNCHGSWVDDYYVKRIEAQAYSAVADDEGYEWGGGCWNNNNKDDTPGAPDSSGEGPDCSGLTFKTWEMKPTMGQGGFRYYDALHNIHGPYTSYDFHAPVASDPFYKLPNKNVSTTIYMDAFAKGGHVGMLYVDSGSPSGLDLIIEALNDASGTDKNYQDYRADSGYVGVRREGWTPDCWPYCMDPDEALVVVP